MHEDPYGWQPWNSCFNFLKKIIKGIIRFSLPFFDIGVGFFQLPDEFRFDR